MRKLPPSPSTAPTGSAPKADPRKAVSGDELPGIAFAVAAAVMIILVFLIASWNGVSFGGL